MFIFSNLATSLDGKIATASRVLFPLGTREDRRMMDVIRRKSDVILFGASTLRAFRSACLIPGAESVNAVVSSDLHGISPNWKFFSESKLRRILFVGHETPSSRIRVFSKSSEIVRLSRSTRSNSTPLQIVGALEKMGFKNLLLEGGGGLMWDFASRDLIDRYYLTLTPRILGGTEAPTLVDGPGLEPKNLINLKLLKCRRVGSELYLVYGKTGRRGLIP